MKPLIFILLVFAGELIFAENSLRATVAGKSYSFVFTGDRLFSSSAADKLEGERKGRIGVYSEWHFLTDKANNDGFLIVLNQKLPKIIKQVNIEASENLSLYSVSPDASMVVLESGLTTLPRQFELLSSNGKSLLRDSYWDMSWSGNEFVYSRAREVPVSFNEKTRKCGGFGTAYEVQKYKFDGERKAKIDVRPTYECGE